MSTTRQVVEAIEAKLALTPSLGLIFGDLLEGPIASPSARAHAGCLVKRVSSSNLDEDRNNDRCRVEDTLEVHLLARLSPKAQKATRGALQDTATSVRNRLADPTWNRPWALTWTDEDEDLHPQGEWLLIVQRYRARRYIEIGGS